MPPTYRPYTFHEYTQSICPDCLSLIPAKIVIKDTGVFLLKTCPIHGQQVELFEEDIEYFLRKRAFDKPGTPSRVQTAASRGCPFDCGLCPEHDQHTCIGLIEVTNHCDLRCPVCYADAGTGDPLPLSVIEKMLNFFQDTENGEADILQISGGEPTTHPEILEILRLAKAKKFRCVMLNTNGLRIAADDDFVRALEALVGDFEIYFQFDGLSDKTSRYFRGRDLTGAKKRALAKLAARGIPTTLVTTVEAGINDGELGHLVAFALGHPNIRGINIQPVAYFGRGKPPAPGRRLTLSGVLTRFEKQTGGMVRKEDFVPLPCNVERVAIAYFRRIGSGFAPLLRDLDLEKRLSLIKNSFAFDLEDYARLTGEKFPGLASGLCNCLGFLAGKKQPSLPPIPATPEQRTKYINENLFRITVNSFVDAYNFDMKSMQKECVHIITPDLKKIPFSSYNLLYRKR